MNKEEKLIALCLLTAIVCFCGGYYTGCYDTVITNRVAEDRAYARLVDEVLAYSGPFAKVTVTGGDVTLSHFLVIGKNLDSGVSVKADKVTLNDPTIQMRDSKYGVEMDDLTVGPK